LQNLDIPLSKDERKHLILTGKNGCGKTSLLDALAVFLNSATTSENPMSAIKNKEQAERNLQYFLNSGADEQEIRKIKENVSFFTDLISKTSAGILLDTSEFLYDIKPAFEKGEFVVAYYRDNRAFSATVPEHVEKVNLKKDYTISDSPGRVLIKYLLDLKMTQALAVSNNKQEKAKKIGIWFDRFQDLLKSIFENDSLQLLFNEDTFKFSIEMNGREPFDFNTMSSGYAAVLDIVVDLILRMENQTNSIFDFTVPGIVLIDEIETHLHLELQKKILGLLTGIFPNIQFIMSTHSPFIVNSLENAVIYDLEKHILVKDGLANVPYDGIVEGYFDSDSMSDILKKKFEEYKEISKHEKLTDEDFGRIAELEMYLDEIPDYLALEITTEYQRIKQELRKREDI